MQLRCLSSKPSPWQIVVGIELSMEAAVKCGLCSHCRGVTSHILSFQKYGGHNWNPLSLIAHLRSVSQGNRELKDYSYGRPSLPKEFNWSSTRLVATWHCHTYFLSWRCEYAHFGDLILYIRSSICFPCLHHVLTELSSWKSYS
jgi:hypothetical protein